MVQAGKATVVRRLITADEFERMGQAGILHEDDRVELIDGEMYQMAALGSQHMGCVIRVTNWLGSRVAGRALVSVQNAVRLSEHSQPQPDVVLLRLREDSYFTKVPGPEDVLLLIEVADSSLGFDRDTKLPRYARAGIAEVWIVDLQRRRITVYREPGPNGYQVVTRHTRGGVLTLAAFPDLQMRWEDIFP